MRDLGLLKIDEPFTKLLTQGMVLRGAYSQKLPSGAKEYYWEKDVDVATCTLKADGSKLDYEMTTMSKSKNNGVDPQELIEKYGADTARLYTMFTAPPELTLEWNESAVEGSYRFLRRVYNFGAKLTAAEFAAARASAAGASVAGISFGKDAKALRLEIHTVLKQVEYDYSRMQYNTVVSGAMKMINALEDFKALDSEGGREAVVEGFGVLLRALYPATPHLAQVLWNELGYDKAMGGLLDAAWPQVDPQALVQDEIQLMLQVNGKLRGSIVVAAGADKASIEAAALANEEYQKIAAGAAPKKIIVVPGRLVNVVV